LFIGTNEGGAVYGFGQYVTNVLGIAEFYGKVNRAIKSRGRYSEMLLEALKII